MVTSVHDSQLQEIGVCLAFWRSGQLHAVTLVRISEADQDFEALVTDENPPSGWSGAGAGGTGCGH